MYLCRHPTPGSHKAQPSTYALTARVLSNGTPDRGRTVNYKNHQGIGNVHFIQRNHQRRRIRDDHAPTRKLCRRRTSQRLRGACERSLPKFLWNGRAAHLGLGMQSVAGGAQEALVGQAFQPFTHPEVTDESSSPNPILGASVVFQSLVGRMPNNEPILWIGQSTSTHEPMPVILSSTQITVLSDINGLATVQPSTGGIQGAVVILGTASVGSASQQYQLQSLPVN